MKYKVMSITGNEIMVEQCHQTLTSFATVVMDLGGVEAPYPMSAVLKSEYFSTALYPGMVIDVIDEEVTLLPLSASTVGNEAQDVQLELDLEPAPEPLIHTKPIRHGK